MRAAPFVAVEVPDDPLVCEVAEDDPECELAVDVEVAVREAEVKERDIELDAILQNDWARFSELFRSDWQDERTQDSRSVENVL